MEEPNHNALVSFLQTKGCYVGNHADDDDEGYVAILNLGMTAFFTIGIVLFTHVYMFVYKFLFGIIRLFYSVLIL